MDSVDLIEPDEEVLYDIKTCIAQWVDELKPDVDEFYVIRVWFPEPARRLLRRQCADDEYVVCTQSYEQYTMVDIAERAMEIWNNKYVPIEIIQSGGALFYGIKKESVKHRSIRLDDLKLME